MYLFTLRQEKKLVEIFTFLKMQLETRQFAVAEKFSRELNPSGHCTNGIAAAACAPPPLLWFSRKEEQVRPQLSKDGFQLFSETFCVSEH